MGRTTKPLSDAEIKKAKILEKDYALFDGDGLQLTVRKNSTKSFEFRYKSPITRTHQKITIGKYPVISLLEAREKRFELMKLLAAGLDPKIEREREKNVGITVTEVCQAFIKHIEKDLSPNTFKRDKGLIDRELIRMLGKKAIKDVTRFDILGLIRDMEKREIVASSKMMLKIATRIWRHSLSEGIIEHNVCLDVDRNVLRKYTQENLPHTTDSVELKEIMQKINASKINFIVKSAIMFSMHTFLRPFNVRFLEWQEVDFDNATISIPAKKMKMRRPHTVPLSPEVIKILREIAKISKSHYVFAMPSGTMSDMTMNRALERIGYKNKQTSHGFRHTASTILHEKMNEHGVHSDAIERQMAHAESGVKGVYNKAEYISERIKLMHWWSKYLTSLYTAENRSDLG